MDRTDLLNEVQFSINRKSVLQNKTKHHLIFFKKLQEQKHSIGLLLVGSFLFIILLDTWFEVLYVPFHSVEQQKLQQLWLIIEETVRLFNDIFNRLLSRAIHLGTETYFHPIYRERRPDGVLQLSLQQSR